MTYNQKIDDDAIKQPINLYAPITINTYPINHQPFINFIDPREIYLFHRNNPLYDYYQTYECGLHTHHHHHACIPMYYY